MRWVALALLLPLIGCDDAPVQLPPPPEPLHAPPALPPPEPVDAGPDLREMRAGYLRRFPDGGHMPEPAPTLHIGAWSEVGSEDAGPGTADAGVDFRQQRAAIDQRTDHHAVKATSDGGPSGPAPRAP